MGTSKAGEGDMTNEHDSTEAMFADRTGWPSGPWDDEQDKYQWRDEATGLPCLIVRHDRYGHLCGYVGVEPGHPWHGKDYDACVVPERCNEPADGWHHDCTPDGNVEVHGGITYADRCAGRVCHVPEPGKPEDVWWFGFDCAHCNDDSPKHPLHSDAAFWLEFRVYRDVPYVRGQCVRLAKQLASIGGGA